MKAKIIFIVLVLTYFITATHALSAPAVQANYDPAKNSVRLFWEKVPGAASYNVYRKQANEPSYARINFSPVTLASYTDAGVGRGGDYLYMVKSLDASGAESADSLSVGAPLMSIDVKASVTTVREKPLSARSIKTGKLVTFAGPGDIITYRITYANRGISSAKNVSINYDIPEGTNIAGVPLVRKGHAASITYFDRARKKWLSRIEKEENVNRVRLTINDPIPPVRDLKDTNGLIDLNVVISL